MADRGEVADRGQREGRTGSLRLCQIILIYVVRIFISRVGMGSNLVADLGTSAGRWAVADIQAGVVPANYEQYSSICQPDALDQIATYIIPGRRGGGSVGLMRRLGRRRVSVRVWRGLLLVV